jgi:DUF4097 and DUF4098 domain-containing protein YvlB
MKSKWIIASVLIVALIALCGASLYAVWAGVQMVQDSGVRFHLNANTTSAKATETKSLTVSGPADLTVVNDFGEVNLASGADEQISVKAEKTAWGNNDAEAQAALKDLKIIYDQTGNQIKITVQQPVEVNTLNVGPGGGSVKFTITVPKATAVTVNSSNGDIALAGTTGRANLQTEFGALTLTNLTGEVTGKSNNGSLTAKQIHAEGAVTLSSEFGSLTIEDVQGSDVTLASTNGTLELTGIQASGLLKATSEFGAIHLSSSRAGTADIHSNNGSVRLEKLTLDGKISVNSDFGDLTLTGVQATAYELETKNGKIHLDGAQGAIRAHSEFGLIEVLNAENATLDLASNNGGVTFSGSLGAGPHSVKSEFGNLLLSLPAATAVEADFQTEFGKITSAFEVALTSKGELDPKHLQGKINGGGDKLTVATNNGNITLETTK